MNLDIVPVVALQTNSEFSVRVVNFFVTETEKGNRPAKGMEDLAGADMSQGK
jgi:hypothetical protein